MSENGFPDVERALAEVRRIIDERAKHPTWIKAAGNIVRKKDLEVAAEILRKCVKITYFEAPD